MVATIQILDQSAIQIPTVKEQIKVIEIMGRSFCYQSSGQVGHNSPFSNVVSLSPLSVRVCVCVCVCVQEVTSLKHALHLLPWKESCDLMAKFRTTSIF